jgi:hypothetical protein
MKHSKLRRSVIRGGLSGTPACSLIGIGLGLLACVTPAAKGDLIISAPNVVASPGTTGLLDLLITDTANSFHIAGDSVELGISGTGVQFIDATTSTATPYIYPSSFDDANGFTLDANGNFPKTDLIASDVDNAPSSFQLVNAGDIFGLAHVSYAVAPDATPGIYNLAIEDIGGGTSLSDENGAAVLFTTVNGTLTVVPEPAIGGICVGIMAIAGLRRRNRISV